MSGSGSSRIMLEQEPREATPSPEPEPPPAPAPEPPASEPSPSAPASEEKPAEAERPEAELSPELRKRIDRLNWEKYEARRQYEELARAVQGWEQQRQAQAQPQQADARAQALQQFRAEAAERDFNERCNAVFQRGSAEYPDFQESVRQLNAVGYGNRPDALAAIAALPEGHHVYRELAQDLDNAARVLSLPPMQMAVELARMAGRRDNAPAPPPGAAAPVTRAPAPLRAVGGNSARGETPLDKTTMADFIRRRDRDDRGGSGRIRRG